MFCPGNEEDHCCWLGKSGVCRWLTETADERRWSCSLRADLGSWDAVYADSRYLADVRPALDVMGVAVDCGDWPTPGERCGTCGGVG